MRAFWLPRTAAASCANRREPGTVRRAAQLALRLPALLLAAACAGCSQSPSLHFNLAPCRHQADQLDVGLSIRGAAPTPLVLRGFAPAEHIRMTGLEVMDTTGRRLTFSTSPLSAANRRRAFDIPRFVIPEPDPQGIEVRYCVKPGLQTGDSHDEIAGSSYGVVTSEFILVRGRQLFLLPETPDQDETIEVTFDPAFPGDVVAPWPRIGGALRPDQAVAHRGREALIAGSVAIGEFAHTSITRPHTQYEFALAPGVTASDRAAVLNPMSRIVRYVDTVVSPAFGDRYLTTIAPALTTGASLVGEAWLTGQSGSFVPVTLTSMRAFARGLLTSLVRDRPSPLSAVGNDLRWMQDGAIEFHTWQALIAAGLISEADAMNYLARSYLQVLGQPTAAVDLTRAYDEGRPTSLVREIVAPLAYAVVADEVRAAGVAPKDPANLLHALIYASHDLTLERILADVPADKRAFLERSVIRDRHTSFLDSFTFVPATSRTPRTPCTGPTTGLRIVYTGNTEGYLENCGCKVNEAGGIARRATVLARLSGGGSRTLLIDAGDFTPAPSRSTASPAPLESEERAFYASFMARSPYDVVFPSTYELALQPAERETLARAIPRYLPPAGHDPADASGAAYRRLQVGGLTVAALALLDPTESPGRPQRFLERLPEYDRRDPVELLRDRIRGIDESADLIVVGGNLRPSTMRRLAAAYPAIDVLVSTDESLEAIARTVGELRGYAHIDQQGFLGDTLVLYPTLGKYGVDKAEIRLDASHRICSADFDTVWLDESVPDDPATRRSLEGFYVAMERKLRPDGASKEAALDARVVAPRGFVGARECRSCHEQEYVQWQNTPHASAYKTLLDRHRHFHPRCVGCHVVGYGAADGFSLAKPDERLANVQCESCHGPGAAHIQSPSTTNIRRTVDEETCRKCHDQAHTNEFDYAKRIARVRHSPESELATSTAEARVSAPR